MSTWHLNTERIDLMMSVEFKPLINVSPTSLRSAAVALTAIADALESVREDVGRPIQKPKADGKKKP